MKTCAQYIADTKHRLGDPRMSDEKLGLLWGVSQSFISRAKHGNMADTIALKVADALGVEAGEVLMVARMERERDPEMRAHLEQWVKTVGKALARVSEKAGGAAVALAVTLGLMMQPQEANAFGGAGGN